MSSDVDVDDEQVLPDSLKKLEIVPIYSHTNPNCKSSNEQNPFFAVRGMDNASCDQRIIKLFGPSCSDCGCNSSTINTIDVVVKTSQNSNRTSGYASHSNCSHGNSDHGIQKQLHFKHREKGAILSEKKLLILREPILKTIGRSVHHNHNNLTSNATAPATLSVCCEQNVSSDGVRISPNSRSYNNNRNNLNNVPIRNRPIPTIDSSASTSNQNWQLQREMPIDFKSLVNDCSNMSLSSTLNAASDNNQTFELHRKKFFQMPQPNAMNNVNSEYDSAGISNVNSNAMNTSISSNSSNSSTCSQQARMNSNSCDVTIDELASYFETFVHIPKKMSSMAEMMYI